MSVAKRIWEIEQRAGMDPADGSTSPSGVASYQWTLDADHMENLDFFTSELENEFGEDSVKVTYNGDDCPVVTLVFNYPYKDLYKELEMHLLMQAAFRVTAKIDKEIEERQETTGQVFSMTCEASTAIVQIKYAGIVIWSSAEAGFGELYDESILEARVREELAKVVETIKMVEGVG